MSTMVQPDDARLQALLVFDKVDQRHTLYLFTKDAVFVGVPEEAMPLGRDLVRFDLVGTTGSLSERSDVPTVVLEMLKDPRRQRAVELQRLENLLQEKSEELQQASDVWRQVNASVLQLRRKVAT